jgi:ankyrin repeat protein
MRMKTCSAILLSLLVCVSCTTFRNDASRTTTDSLGSFSNPVRCDGPEGEREYLNRLFAPDGTPVSFHRVGSFGAGPYGNLLDGYEVHAVQAQAMVYMDMYHSGHVEAAAVPGFNVVSIAGDQAITLPTNMAAHAEIVRNTIQAFRFDAPGEELVPRITKLLSSGLDVNARDMEGNTALLMAASHLHRPAKVFKVLLDAGADVNAQNNEGNTALHMMLNWAELDIEAVRLLLDRGISVTSTNENGDTAFAGVAWALDDEDAVGEGAARAETNTHLVAARLLLDAGAGKWKDYMGAPVTVLSGSPYHVDPIVKRLSDPTQRDEAFRTVLSWQKYRSQPSAPERFFKPLRHVVVCPQAVGPPIYAVFPWTTYEQRPAPKGHVILIDADGAMIPHYINANSINDVSEFRDINGDRIIDEISAIGTGKAYVLHVLPVTREQKPALNILLRKKGFNETEWSWRLAPTAQSDVFAIELGLNDPKTSQLHPRVTYEWSETTHDYVGPTGGDGLPFKRMPGAMTWPSEEYNSFVGTRKNEE